MYSYVDLTATVLNCRLYRPKLARFYDNAVTFAVNGLLYPYFT